MCKQEEKSKIAIYIEYSMSTYQQERLKDKLGWSKYTWTWRLNNPTKWTTEELVVFSKFIDKPWKDCVQEYDIAKELVAPLLRA